MGFGCKTAPPPHAGSTPTPPRHVDVAAIIEENITLLDKGARGRSVRFPEIRELFSPVELIATFSHLTPNLPFDEVFGNYVLGKIKERLGWSNEQLLNCAYDNYIPENDKPKAYTVQFGIVNPKILKPDIIPSLQSELAYDHAAFYKDGQNRVKSAPEQKFEEFRARFDQLDAVYQKHSRAGDVSQLLVGIRRELLALIGFDVVPEVPYSRALQRKTADVLELLYKKGYPFWEMPVPEEKYRKHTFLVEGIDATRHRRAVRFERGEFVFPFAPQQEKRIPAEKIFDAIRNLEVIPTMPLVILTLATAPQIPHLGGGVWKHYAPLHTDAQARWLGIDEGSETLILSTGGHKLLTTYRRNEEFIAFPTVYLTYGPELIRKALTEGLSMRVEFKRVVL